MVKPYQMFMLKKALEIKQQTGASAVYQPFDVSAKFKGEEIEYGRPESILSHYEVTVTNLDDRKRKIKFDFWEHNGIDCPKDAVAAFGNFVYSAMCGSMYESFAEFAEERGPFEKGGITGARAEFNADRRAYKKWLRLTDKNVFEFHENFKWDLYPG